MPNFVNLEQFAEYILPAAPLDFVERVASIGLDEGQHCVGKEIAENEIRTREHEQREYVGPEPMDEYLTATMVLKFNGKISAKDNVRWHEDKKAIVFAVYDKRAELVGVLMVKPLVLQQLGNVQ